MSFFKCKMCGGTIEFEQGATVGVCDSCGTKQTLPRLDDDRRANLYDRANHFRRNNEFDKAAGIYEQILTEDVTDAEAYWSLVLCQYGIEYVEDPATRKRVPTVNRAQFTSIFDDDNYKSALQYADGYQRELYEKEAKEINEIQKGILAISQKEEPFDVFICYKETDQNGRRTPDSVLATDLYHQLTQEGFKVFFSRITLEDKLGTAYEPYIFAALNSAKVMVVLGTKPEYFNAVWVKNEWSRYLALVKKSGGKKILIPAYKDMDPYDLPEEFSHLQAQDMSKLGFMQDLIRGIKKIAKTDGPKATVREAVVVNTAANANIAPLLKRAFMFLEDGEWSKADDFCEQVLNQDPENAQAYLGKLMAELRVRRREDLQNCELPFDRSNHYQKAVRFGDEKLEAELRGYITHINERNENTRLTGIYNRASEAMNTANSEDAYKAAAETFRTIPGFRDADSLAEQCIEKAETCIYNRASEAMNTANSEAAYKAAAETFQTIPGFKDADMLAEQCIEKAETCIYNRASKMMNAANSEAAYKAAAETFKTIPGFKDADSLVEQCLDKAEVCRKKASAVACALKEGVTKSGPTLEERLAATKTKVGYLERILNVFDATQSQIQALQSEFNAAISREKQLADQRSRLGLFAGKEKKRIDEELASVSAKKSDLATRIEQNLKTLGKYSSTSDVEHDLKEARNSVNDLEVQIESSQKNADNEYSFEEALNIYLNQTDVAAAVNAIYPAISVIYGKTNTVKFGKYVQKENGLPEPIEWLVLAKEGNKALMISKYELDCQQYNTSVTKVTWETCSLRKWLNGTFLSAAFSSEEQNSIISSTVTADKNLSYSTSPGNNTTDKVFLLSITEANKYFKSDEARKCAPTDYAIAQGAWTSDSYKTGGRATCWWWLRSPGGRSKYAAVVYSDGSVYDLGDDVSFGYFGVRPALWINLGS